MYFSPPGSRDWLPQEFESKRRIESAVRSVFSAWSYSEMAAPIFESAELFRTASGVDMSETLHLGGPSGSDLILRTEMTTPIARAVCSRMRDTSLPLRLSYVSLVFRHEARGNRFREMTQAGAELIGCSGTAADAEALFMAMETVDAAGLSDAMFDINDVRITEEILSSIFDAHEPVVRCKRLIAERNFVALRELRNRPGMDAAEFDAFLDVLTRRGQEDALSIARRLCKSEESLRALENLADLLKRAALLGYTKRVMVDFSLLRKLQYYTGLVFEGYVPDIGSVLCGGGRYDSLLPQLGMEAPAVGWMVEVESLLLALERRQTGAKSA